MTVTRRDGSVLLSRAVTLDPHGSRQFHSPEINQQRSGSVGGISIQHDGAPGAILAAGYVQSASRHISTSISFVDPATLYGSNIYGAGVQLGQHRSSSRELYRPIVGSQSLQSSRSSDRVFAVRRSACLPRHRHARGW